MLYGVHHPVCASGAENALLMSGNRGQSVFGDPESKGNSMGSDPYANWMATLSVKRNVENSFLSAGIKILKRVSP